MAGNLFDVPWAEITMVDHEAQYGFCRYIKLDAQDVATQELKDSAFSKIYEPLSYDKDGEPFLCRARIPRLSAFATIPFMLDSHSPYTIYKRTYRLPHGLHRLPVSTPVRRFFSMDTSWVLFV
jgi:hypothetical protein